MHVHQLMAAFFHPFQKSGTNDSLSCFWLPIRGSSSKDGAQQLYQFLPQGFRDTLNLVTMNSCCNGEDIMHVFVREVEGTVLCTGLVL